MIDFDLRLKSHPGQSAEEDDQLLDFHQAVSEVMEAEERLIEDHRTFLKVGWGNADID